MMQYISSKENLKTIMNLLRNKSSHIQFETFHVFKIFVANPKKTAEISSILYKNKSKLIAYLEHFHLDKDDPQFVDEKRLLIDTLQVLENPGKISPKGNPESQKSSSLSSRSDHASSASATPIDGASVNDNIEKADEMASN